MLLIPNNYNSLIGQEVKRTKYKKLTTEIPLKDIQSQLNKMKISRHIIRYLLIIRNYI